MWRGGCRACQCTRRRAGSLTYELVETLDWEDDFSDYDDLLLLDDDILYEKEKINFDDDDPF